MRKLSSERKFLDVRKLFHDKIILSLRLGVKCIDLRHRNVAASSLGTQLTPTPPSLKHNTASKKTDAQLRG